MIEGPSGAGKTSAAFGLLDRARQYNIEVHFIADDQVFLESDEDILIAHAPDMIAGKAELYGFGIVEIPHISRARIDLVAEIVDQEKIVRMPDLTHCTRQAVTLSYVKIPYQHEQQAIRIIMAKINQLLQEKA